MANRQDLCKVFIFHGQAISWFEHRNEKPGRTDGWVDEWIDGQTETDMVNLGYPNPLYFVGMYN